jgi:hypothetical protein
MIEILTFRLLTNADVDAFKQADADAQQTFFYAQPENSASNNGSSRG